MADSLTTVVTQVRDYLREPAGTPGSFWSDAQIIQAINQALKRLEDLALEHGPWFLESKVASNIVNGTYAYTFPTITGSTIRRVRMLAAYAPGDDTNYPPRKLTEVPLPLGVNATSFPFRQMGTPTTFWFTGPAAVEIRPTPSYALTNGLVWYVYKALTVVAGSDVIPLPDPDTYSELICMSAVLNLMMMDEEIPSQRYQAIHRIREDRLRDYIVMLCKGRNTSPRTIQVVAY